MVQETASAKVNLYLHVGALRDDGLHDLASLFVFTDFGDQIDISPSVDEAITLDIDGPFASALAPFAIDDNLVVRAARALRAHCAVSTGARIRLTKNLPIAAGIGGGSADGAAALRALIRFWGLAITDADLATLAFNLGADVPACLQSNPILVRGAGEIIEPGPALPALHLCLLNPGVETPTGPIFKAFDTAHPAPASPRHLPMPSGARVFTPGEIIASLAQTRNDLQAPAVALVPLVKAPIEFLQAQDGCRLARMSGSGATSFGLFDTPQQARMAAKAGKAKGWWAKAGQIRQSP